ncbi:MAG: triose-phosphate isomerase [Candidatus Methanomethyliaceae archaeon]|nr:triose-phosphate isomerase [Candidatus Methanomethyliaceae archaeon]MDW7970848.1 triose-phosphate isomerase [Nitrososphaerota archaeon]
MRVFYPLLLINFKTYIEALGDRGLNLAKIAEKISLEYGVCIAVAPQFVDIKMIAEEVSIPIFAQHIDPYMPGAYTGHITPESIKEAGAHGTLLNHSERRLRVDEIELSLNRCKELNLICCICAGNTPIAISLSMLNPEMVAVEPPELIGSGISVSKAKPEIVKSSVEAIKRINPSVHVLCGAGISDDVDVRKAIELGSEGILVASSIVKSKDPEKLLQKFAKAMLSS